MSQVSIVSDFNRQATSFPIEIEDTYEGTRGKPLSFLSMPSELPDTPYQPKQVKAALRSIRAPKFSVEYTVSSNDTVFSLKERLLSDPENPLGDTEQSLTSIRLMLKSKAISDVRTLGELPSTNFTVMFSATKSSDNFVPTKAYWGESSDSTPASTSAAAATETEPEQVSEPQNTPKADNHALIQELSQVLARHGRSDLIEKIKSIV